VFGYTCAASAFLICSTVRQHDRLAAAVGAADEQLERAAVVGRRYPQSPPRPPASRGHRYPLSAKPFAEGIGVRRIGETESDVVLLVVMPSTASPRVDASLAMEGQYVVRLGSEAA
jgi:hypothetical protein